MNTNRINLWDNEDMTGTIISPVVDLNAVLHMSVQVTWIGTPTGDLYLEVSNNQTDWELLATAAVAGAGAQMWMDRNTPYVFIRLRYVPTASTGTITGISITKGDE